MKIMTFNQVMPREYLRRNLSNCYPLICPIIYGGITWSLEKSNLIQQTELHRLADRLVNPFGGCRCIP